MFIPEYIHNISEGVQFCNRYSMKKGQWQGEIHTNFLNHSMERNGRYYFGSYRRESEKDIILMKLIKPPRLGGRPETVFSSGRLHCRMCFAGWLSSCIKITDFLFWAVVPYRVVILNQIAASISPQKPFLASLW